MDHKPIVRNPLPNKLYSGEKRSKHRTHIESVMNTMRNDTQSSYGVNRERLNDIKSSKLDQIAQLKMILEEEGIDCSALSNPNIDSTLESIDETLAILKLKNDRNRYASLAEELILGIAEVIEWIFDGSRAVPILGWKPDYTGYHNTVNAKLHRMRGETSDLIGNFVNKHKIGTTTRIVTELLPSFLLYPRQQRKQKNMPSLYDEMNMQSRGMSAYSDIRRNMEQ